MTIIPLKSGALAALDLVPGEKPLPAVLIVHGWKSADPFGSYSGLAETLKGLGYHTLILSLRGHGASKGKMGEVTRAEHLIDIAEAIRLLKSAHFVLSDEVSAIGVSYGGYLLSALPPQGNLKRLALRVPALYPDKDFEAPTQSAIDDPNLKDWRSNTEVSEENRALAGIAGFSGEVLLVTSEDDTIVGPAVFQKYRNALAGNPHFSEREIEGAEHVLTPPEKEQFHRIVAEWFRSEPGP